MWCAQIYLKTLLNIKSQYSVQRLSPIAMTFEIPLLLILQHNYKQPVPR